MNEEYVILVDEQDSELGLMEKIKAHQQGALHRAISVFIFNSQKQLLLQQRASDKYHSGGLWTNTCCSHPRKGEQTQDAAKRRLREEMGIDCELNYLTNIIYKAKLDNDMTEHELDHIFIGYTDDVPVLNPAEAIAYRYTSIEDVERLLQKTPEHFTKWFGILLAALIKQL